MYFCIAMPQILSTTLLLILGIVNAQLHFPTDYHNDGASSEFFMPGPPIYQQNSATAYEDMVDGIISNGINKMCVSIAKSLAKSNDECSVFAPVNIAGALAMLLLGSGGATFQELANVMGLATGVDIHSKSQLVHTQFGRMLKKLDEVSTFDLGEEVILANALFVQDNYPIRGVYKRIAQDVYRSEIMGVDFMKNPSHAKTLINNWVNDRTRGMIREMLQEVPTSDTKVIITAALYFKAAWENPFYQGFTQSKPFYPDGRDSPSRKMVKMMANGGLFPYYEDKTLDCKILGFPYKGNRSAMYVVMPNNSNRQKLIELQKRLTAEDLEQLVANTKYMKSIIMFPKMSLESNIDLRGPLEDLGVHSLFSPGQANLGLLSNGRDRIPPGLNGHPVFGNFNHQGKPFGPPGGTHNKNGFIPNRNTETDDEPMFIFSRVGEDTGNATTDNNTETTDNKTKNTKDRPKRQIDLENLDSLRSTLTQHDNPGLYVDKVIHKVHMDVTELGTEAAASTSATLSRGGDYITFRVDAPFLFFVRNHDTKIILFWGTVITPTPNENN